MDSLPSVSSPDTDLPAISRINFKSVPLISPLIFRLVIRFLLSSVIIVGKEPATTPLRVTCSVIKPSSAACIDRHPRSKHTTNISCLLHVKIFIRYSYFMLLYSKFFTLRKFAQELAFEL